MISFTVVGLPVPQGSKTPGVTKTGRRFVRESNRSLPGWRQLVADQAQRHAPPTPLQGPIRLDLTFRLPMPKSLPKRRRLAHTTKPDRLKLARSVEDSLKGIFWRDDSQVVAGETRKAYAYEAPIGVDVQIVELEPDGVRERDSDALATMRAEGFVPFDEVKWCGHREVLWVRPQDVQERRRWACGPCQVKGLTVEEGRTDE